MLNVTTTLQMEVRCCCQPKKLLGWLPVDWRIVAAGPGRVVRFRIPATPLRRRLLSVRQLEDLTAENLASSLSIEMLPREDVDLPIAWYFNLALGYPRLALKSEDTPIETLRRIPGFSENPLP